MAPRAPLSGASPNKRDDLRRVSSWMSLVGVIAVNKERNLQKKKETNTTTKKTRKILQRNACQFYCSKFDTLPVYC